MFNQYQQDNFMNAVNLAAFIVGIMNMEQNQAQTEYNDVHAANDLQEKHILDALGKRLDEQDAMLKEILRRLDKGTP